MPIDIETLPQSNVVVVIETASEFDLRKQQSAPAATLRSGGSATITTSASASNRSRASCYTHMTGDTRFKPSSASNTPVKGVADKKKSTFSWCVRVRAADVHDRDALYQVFFLEQKARHHGRHQRRDVRRCITAASAHPPVPRVHQEPVRKSTRPAPYGAPKLHTAERSRSRGMSMASDADGADSPAPRKTPPPVKTASPARAGRSSGGGSFDKQTSRPEFISYANVTKAAPSGILPTPPKRHSNSRLSLGSDVDGSALSPSRAVASRTPTSYTSGAVDSSLPLTPTAGPTVSDISEQPQQVGGVHCSKSDPPHTHSTRTLLAQLPPSAWVAAARLPRTAPSAVVALPGCFAARREEDL